MRHDHTPRAERPASVSGRWQVRGEEQTMRPALDKVMPEAWQAAQAFSSAIRDAASARGLSAPEGELIKVRASQLNAFDSGGRLVR